MIPHGLMFHHFHDSKHPKGQGSLSASDFDRLISHVGKDHILPAREWLKRALSGTLKDHDTCLTFDDNLRCQFDVALPVLKSHGLDAFWFVYTSVLEGKVERLEIYRHFRNTHFTEIEEFYDEFFYAVETSEFQDSVELALQNFHPETYLKEFSFYTPNDRKFRFLRDHALGVEHYNKIMDAMLKDAGFDGRKLASQLWMNKAQLKELHDAGHVVGLHSHTHPTNLAALPEVEQEAEYAKNQEALKAILGEMPTSMSHPCNSYSEKTLQILKRMGVQLGFRSNMTKTDNLVHLEFPREDHAEIWKRIDL